MNMGQSEVNSKLIDNKQKKNKNKWNFTSIILVIGYYSNISFYIDYLNENKKIWVLVLSLCCYLIFYIKRKNCFDWTSKSYLNLFFSIFLFLSVFLFSFFFWNEMTIMLKILVLINIVFYLLFLFNSIKLFNIS